jgi:hypothetical protein
MQKLQRSFGQDVFNVAEETQLSIQLFQLWQRQRLTTNLRININIKRQHRVVQQQ